MNFSGKKILITGGSSGIGKAMIAELYRRGVRQFAVIGRNGAKLQALQQEFPEATFILITADFAESASAQKSIEHIQHQWNSLDILVNNAGVVSAGPLESISDEDITRMQMINVAGPILLTKHALPLLKQSS